MLIDLGDDGEKWIPKSVIHPDSEVFDSDNASGKLIIYEWFAEKNGF